MNIGDVFMRVVADDKGFEKEVVTSAERAGTKGGKALGANMGKTAGTSFGAQFKSAFKPANLVSGLGLGAGIGIFGAATSAISGVVGALGDMTQAAIDDEASQTRLLASLQANVPAFDGNTAAIEEAITATQRLGFDDEALRESLALLVPVTHDIAEAQNIQATAMDLARFKGVDLRTATEALIKVEGGQYRLLKQLGIRLEEGATATEALAEVQRVAGGQAEAYAETTAGAMEATQIALSEVGEDIGKLLLPVMEDLAKFARDDLVPAIEDLMPVVEEAGELFGEVGGTIGDVGSTIGEVLPVIDMLTILLTAVTTPLRVVATGWGILADVIGVAAEAIGIHIGDADQAWRQAEGWEVYTQSLLAAGPGIDAAAAEAADGIPEAMEDALEEGEKVARKTPGSLASQLREGIDDYDAALEELTVVAENSVSDLAERQKIEGILASEELTEALNSDSTRTRLMAMDLVNDLVSDYELLAPGALGAGELVNPQLRDGLSANLNLVETAVDHIVVEVETPLSLLGQEAYTWGLNTTTEFALGMSAGVVDVSTSGANAARAVRDQIGVFSEPKAYDSPLRGITKWGGNIVKTLAQGMMDELGTGAMAARSLAGALVPAMPQGAAIGAVAGVSGAAAGIGGGVTYILQVNGVDKTVGTREDVLRAWEQMRGFTDRGGQGG